MMTMIVVLLEAQAIVKVVGQGVVRLGKRASRCKALEVSCRHAAPERFLLMVSIQWYRGPIQAGGLEVGSFHTAPIRLDLVGSGMGAV